MFKPELQDPELIAQLFWAGTHGVVSQHLTRSGEGYVAWRPIEDQIKLMTGTLLAGLLTNPVTAPTAPKKNQATKPRKA